MRSRARMRVVRSGMRGSGTNETRQTGAWGTERGLQGDDQTDPFTSRGTPWCPRASARTPCWSVRTSATCPHSRSEEGPHFCSFHSARSGMKSARAELIPRSSRYASNSVWTPSSRLSNCECADVSNEPGSKGRGGHARPAPCRDPGASSRPPRSCRARRPHPGSTQCC